MTLCFGHSFIVLDTCMCVSIKTNVANGGKYFIFAHLDHLSIQHAHLQYLIILFISTLYILYVDIGKSRLYLFQSN